MFAEHIIGLSALERAREDVAAARRRYEAIARADVLRPRGDAEPGLLDPGSAFDLDVLAGDGRYVFLSYGPRYRAIRRPELVYGWLFDAEALVRAGALVGPDLLSDYEEIADRIATEMAAELPPSAPATNEDVALFADLFGDDDPAMLAAVREMSADGYWDIIEALEHGQAGDPLADESRHRFRAAAAGLQGRRRVSGNEALARLRSESDTHFEILFPGGLPLTMAVGRIEAGVMMEVI